MLIRSRVAATSHSCAAVTVDFHRKIFRMFILVLFLPLLMKADDIPRVSIIPKPLSVTVGSGHFTLEPQTKILWRKSASALEPLAVRLSETIHRATGFSADVSSIDEGDNTHHSIVLTDRPKNSGLGEEGYELTVAGEGVTIAASHPPGVFYGIQSLLQLLPPQIEGSSITKGVEWTVPYVAIVDSPRFRWRGVHLDVGRHFFPKAFIEKYLDLMASYKMNTFHWHLTEDQGWRIRIDRYPKLTEIGSKRAETMGDSTPYAGFYTKDDIREIVRYAADRFITIVPEIEMPGHSLAAIAAYPELSCTGGPFKVGTVWGVYDDVYCAGNEKTFEFLENVLDEVMDLFPGKVIHLGGDECPKVRWKACPKCQARMKAEGLKSEEELQSYFMKRIERYLNDHGRTVIGWDEILEGGLPPNARVMSWRGTEGGIAAAKAGHDVVMTPGEYCYFDKYQGKGGEPVAIGGFLPIDTVYAYEPVPSSLSQDEARHILGAQANMWTEYMPDEPQVEYMLMPRLCALSEVDWSPASAKDFADFRLRLDGAYNRLAARGVNFRVPPPDGIGGKAIFFNDTTVTLIAPARGARIHITLDGTEPDSSSAVYTTPIKITASTLLSARTLLPCGRMSHTISTLFSRVNPAVNGVDFDYYEGEWSVLPDFDKLTALRSGRAYDVDLDAFPHRPENYAVKFTSMLNIGAAGNYTFYLASDDGSCLFIDGKEVVNNDSLHGASGESGTVTLTEGKHRIVVTFFQRGGAASLEVSWEAPGIRKQPLPPSILFSK